MATRIPTGERITAEKLSRTEAAESWLMALGLRDFRVRMQGNAAKLQVRSADLPMVMQNRARIVEELKKYYPMILLDLEVRE